MLVPVAQWIVSLFLLWPLAYLIVLSSRKRLPFYEGEVVEAHLSSSAVRTGRSRFVVRFRLALSGGRNRTGAFVFLLAGEPEHIRESSRCSELQGYYLGGTRIRAHYVPYCEWLFGLIPEAPKFTQRAAFVGTSAIFISAVIWTLYLLGVPPM